MRTPARATLVVALLTLPALLALLAVFPMSSAIGAAQAPAKHSAWFGVPLPPSPGKEPAVMVGDRAPRPVSVPAGEPPAPELSGAAIKADLETIVGFSKESRKNREVGSGPDLGPHRGLPVERQDHRLGRRTVPQGRHRRRQASADRAGAERTSFWLPLSWEVRLLGDPAFGPGSADVVLESAMPLSPSDIPAGTLTAPLVYVGTASPAVIQHIDVKGKIAVQLTVPQGHMVFERGAVALARAGSHQARRRRRLQPRQASRQRALPRLQQLRQSVLQHRRPRRLLSRERHGPRRARPGRATSCACRSRSKTETHTNLKAENGVAVIPGRRATKSSSSTLTPTAGSTGPATTPTASRCWSRWRGISRSRRTGPIARWCFVASAGHHSPGMNGPREFRRRQPRAGEAARC